MVDIDTSSAQATTTGGGSPSTPSTPYREWKIVLRPGAYAYPVMRDGKVTNRLAYFSPRKSRQYAQTVKSMLADGIVIPIVPEHSVEAKPITRADYERAMLAGTVGFVRDAKVDENNNLWLLHEVSDPEWAAKMGVTVLDCSPGFRDWYKTGDGKMWRDVVAHVALTNHPVDHRKPKFSPGETPKKKKLIASGIAVLAADTGRVLMLQRANEEKDHAAGMWEFPGGHIEDDENPFDAAKREWSEETGMKFPSGKRIGDWTSSDGVYQGFVWQIPKEEKLDINKDPEKRKVLNPDDPDGDNIETVAWWMPGQLPGNPALRTELAKEIHKVVAAITGSGNGSNANFSVMFMSLSAIDGPSAPQIVPIWEVAYGAARECVRKSGTSWVFKHADGTERFGSREGAFAWLRRQYSKQFSLAREAGGGSQIWMAVMRAPVGGVNIQGRFYRGGQFIPNEVMNRATPEEKEKIQKARADYETKRGVDARGHMQDAEGVHDAILRHAGDHAHVEQGVADKKHTLRRWAALKNEHGEKGALERVVFLAATEAKKLKEMGVAQGEGHLDSIMGQWYQRRLAAYAQMVGFALNPESVGEYKKGIGGAGGPAIAGKIEPQETPKPERMAEAARVTKESERPGERPGGGSQRAEAERPGEGVPPSPDGHTPQAAGEGQQDTPDSGPRQWHRHEPLHTYMKEHGASPATIKSVKQYAHEMHKAAKESADTANKAIAMARKTLEQYTGKRVTWNNAGMQLADPNALKGFDSVANSVAKEFPGLFTGDDEKGHQEQLMEMLRKGKVSSGGLREHEERALEEWQQGGGENVAGKRKKKLGPSEDNPIIKTRGKNKEEVDTSFDVESFDGNKKATEKATETPTEPQAKQDALPAKQPHPMEQVRFIGEHPGTIPHEKMLSDEEQHKAYVEHYKKQGKSSRLEPAPEGINPPVGTWRKSGLNGVYGHDIEQLQEIPVKDVLLSEDDYTQKGVNPEGRGWDAERYAEWIKEGKEPPAVHAVMTDKGTLKITDGHRRLAAHKMAGKETIKAWVSPTMPTKWNMNGNPEDGPVPASLTHEAAIEHSKNPEAGWKAAVEEAGRQRERQDKEKIERMKADRAEPEPQSDFMQPEKASGPHTADHIDSYAGQSFTSDKGHTVDVRKATDGSGTWSVGSKEGLTKQGVANHLNAIGAVKAKGLFGDEVTAQGTSKPQGGTPKPEWAPVAKPKDNDATALPGMKDTFAPGMFGKQKTEQEAMEGGTDATTQATTPQHLPNPPTDKLPTSRPVPDSHPVADKLNPQVHRSGERSGEVPEREGGKEGEKEKGVEGKRKESAGGKEGARVEKSESEGKQGAQGAAPQQGGTQPVSTNANAKVTKLQAERDNWLAQAAEAKAKGKDPKPYHDAAMRVENRIKNEQGPEYKPEPLADKSVKSKGVPPNGEEGHAQTDTSSKQPPPAETAQVKSLKDFADVDDAGGGTQHRIEDFGEKIGGARKDTSMRIGPRDGAGKKDKSDDERPAWQRQYHVEQDAKTGEWFVAHAKSKQLLRQKYKTKEEAEKAVPLYEVARNHTVYNMRRGKEGKDDYAIVRKLGDRKRPIVKSGFESEDAAMKYMAAHPEEIIEHKFNFPEEVPHLEHIQRIGPERRKGHIAPKDFKDTFDFRAGEFGNWNMGKDGQAALNHAYEALHDLAEVLGVDPKAMSLNGKMAIAFGARGTGGKNSARAHYEPDKAVINLTKIRGAGTLAHEWLHALDHHIGSLARPAGLSASDVSLASTMSRHPGLRPELAQAFKKVMDTIASKEEERKVTVSDTRKEGASKYLKDTLDELDRRMDVHKQYYPKRFKGLTPDEKKQWDALKQKIVDLDVGEQSTVHGAHGSFKARYTYAPIEELNKLFKKATGASFATMDDHSSAKKIFWQIEEVKRTNARVKAAEEGKSETYKTRTDFFDEARKIDQHRLGDYWSIPEEMAARAFESYIIDRIKGKGNRSDYLVYGAKNNPINSQLGKPYPEGEEREAINAAFDNLFKVLDKKELYSKDPPKEESKSMSMAAALGGVWTAGNVREENDKSVKVDKSIMEAALSA